MLYEITNLLDLGPALICHCCAFSKLQYKLRIYWEMCIVFRSRRIVINGAFYSRWMIVIHDEIIFVALVIICVYFSVVARIYFSYFVRWRSSFFVVFKSVWIRDKHFVSLIAPNLFQLTIAFNSFQFKFDVCVCVDILILNFSERCMVYG